LKIRHGAIVVFLWIMLSPICMQSLTTIGCEMKKP